MTTKTQHEKRFDKISEWIDEAEEYRERHCAGKQCSECEEDCRVPTMYRVFNMVT